MTHHPPGQQPPYGAQPPHRPPPHQPQPAPYPPSCPPSSSTPPPPYAPYPTKPTRGPLPMVLGIVGGVLLAGAAALFVVAVLLFTSTVPLGVLDRDGGPGSDAVTSGEPPTTLEVELQADQSYMLHVAAPSSADAPRLESVPEVTAPSGESRLMSPAEISSTASMGGTSAVGRHSYTADESGLHTVEIDAFTDAEQFAEGETFVVLSPGGDFAGLMGGVFGILGSIFGGIALGTVGLGLLIAGIVLGIIRRRRRREQPHDQRPGWDPSHHPQG